MYDIVFNKNTGRHELEFINQQFDYLMGIRFYEETNQYQLSEDVQKAKQICKEWGDQNFDVDYWMKKAALEIEAKDNEFLNKS